jgi:hypothetical protein
VTVTVDAGRDPARASQSATGEALIDLELRARDRDGEETPLG